jgi:hypothetical protein
VAVVVDQMTSVAAVVLVPGWKEPLLSEIQRMLLSPLVAAVEQGKMEYLLQMDQTVLLLSQEEP